MILKRLIRLVCVASVAAAACTSPNPVAPEPGRVGNPGTPAEPSVPVKLQILGLPSTLQRGTSATLTAQLVAPGNTTNCGSRASWQTDQPAIASITSSGELTGRSSGAVAVFVSCDELTATAETTVQWVAPRVWIRSCDAAASGGTCSKRLAQEVTSAGATVEFLDGPLAGKALPEDGVALLTARTITFPARVRLTARFFEPVLFVLTESSAFSTLPGDVQFVVPMYFVGSGDTDSYVSDAQHAIYRFTTQGAGQVEIGTYWSYNDPSHHLRVVTELWCNGQRLGVGGDSQYGQGHAGPEFSRHVAAGSACEVRVVESAGLYRLTVSYPH